MCLNKAVLGPVFNRNRVIFPLHFFDNPEIFGKIQRKSRGSDFWILWIVKKCKSKKLRKSLIYNKIQ